MRTLVLFVLVLPLVAGLANAQSDPKWAPAVKDVDLAPGAVHKHDLMLSNNGVAPATYTMNVSAPNGWNGTVSPSTATLAPTQTQAVQLMVRIPPDAPLDARGDFLVYAQSAGGQASATLRVHVVETGANASTTTPPPTGVSSDGPPPSDASGATSAMVPSSTREAQADPAPPPAPPSALAQLAPHAVPLAWAATAGSAGFGASWFVASESARWRWRLLLLGLFSRLQKDELLEHAVRERIVDAIQRTPGLHFGGLRRELGLATGTLTHHLWMLEDQEVVRSSRDGFKRRFYPKGRADWGPAPPTEAERAVLEAVAAEPGLDQTRLAQRVGMSKQLVGYHVGRLAARGRLVVEREGRVTHVYPGRGA